VNSSVLRDHVERTSEHDAAVQALSDGEGQRFVRGGPVGERGMQGHHARVLRQAIDRLPRQASIDEGASK